MINRRYILLYHLLKPIYIIIFNISILLKNKIILSDKYYLNKGKFKKAYIHPHDKDKCIKVLHKENKLWDYIMLNIDF